MLSKTQNCCFQIGLENAGMETNADIQTPDIYEKHSSSGRRTENDAGEACNESYRITSISTIIPDSVFLTVVKILEKL